MNDSDIIASFRAQLIANTIAMRLLLGMSPTLRQVLRDMAATHLDDLLRDQPMTDRQKEQARSFLEELAEPLSGPIH